jgi:DNA-binding transcriptional MerR regulator
MESELTIQQVAARTGLSAHTLRYYERIGLLDPVGRAESGHRRYAAADLAWLDFLTHLRATGMPIRQMREFAALLRRGPATARERRLLLEDHRRAVQGRIRALKRNLALIDEKIAYYSDLEQDNITCRGGAPESVAEVGVEAHWALERSSGDESALVREA